VAILWAQKLQTLQVIRIQQEFLMANPSDSRTGNVSCSCDGPGCSGFCLPGLTSGLTFVFVLLQSRTQCPSPPKVLIGSRWCCFELGDRNLRPIEDYVTLTHEHYVTASFVNI